MDCRVELELRGVPKSRPRFNTYTGRAITDKKTKDFEQTVAWLYKSNGGKYFKDKNIRMRVEFHFEVPKSYTKKKKEEALNGIVRPTRSDIDNLLKSVQDGLNGIAYLDDRTICEISAIKKYSDKDRIVIGIEEIK